MMSGENPYQIVKCPIATLNPAITTRVKLFLYPEVLSITFPIIHPSIGTGNIIK